MSRSTGLAFTLLTLLLQAGRADATGCAPAFDDHGPIPDLGAPESVVVADVNGDGRPDLVAVTGGRLVVLLNDEMGHFGAAIPVASGDGTCAVGDFDGDGRLDIAFANRTSNAAEVYRGLGDGRFLLATRFPAGTYPIMDVASGDIDGDGATDLAVLQLFSIDVHLQRNGALASEAMRTEISPSGDLIWAVDLDGDGRSDFLFEHGQFGGTNLYVCRSRRDGTCVLDSDVAPAGGYHLGFLFTSADFDADGRLDLVVSSFGNSPNPPTFKMFRGIDGGFERPAAWSLELPPAAGVAAASPARSLTEIAMVASYGPSGAAVLILYRASGTTMPTELSRQYLYAPGAIAFADFDGDGILDLVVWNSGDPAAARILKGTCPVARYLPVRAGPASVAPRRAEIR